MSNHDVVRCKQCGKIIVGNSKMGLCEQCFSTDAKVSGGILAGLTALAIKFRKPIAKGLRAAARFIFRA